MSTHEQGEHYEQGVTSLVADTWKLCRLDAWTEAADDESSIAEATRVKASGDQPSSSRSRTRKSRLPHTPPRRAYCDDGWNAPLDHSTPQSSQCNHHGRHRPGRWTEFG